MRIEQLIYLADIAQTGSITTTAQRVFLSQQAVSESIRNLEKELGYQLLNRSKTGVRLTQRGQLVTEYAQDIVQKYHDMISELATVVDTSSFVGNLTIASSPMVSKTLIPGVQEYLGKYHPDFLGRQGLSCRLDYAIGRARMSVRKGQVISLKREKVCRRRLSKDDGRGEKVGRTNRQ